MNLIQSVKPNGQTKGVKKLLNGNVKKKNVVLAFYFAKVEVANLFQLKTKQGNLVSSHDSNVQKYIMNCYRIYL